MLCIIFAAWKCKCSENQSNAIANFPGSFGSRLIILAKHASNSNEFPRTKRYFVIVNHSNEDTVREQKKCGKQTKAIEMNAP
jgi:hypothetical protein